MLRRRLPFVHRAWRRTRSNSLVSGPRVPAKGPDTRLMKPIHSFKSEMWTPCRLPFWKPPLEFLRKEPSSTFKPGSVRHAVGCMNRWPSFPVSVCWNSKFFFTSLLVAAQPLRGLPLPSGALMAILIPFSLCQNSWGGGVLSVTSLLKALWILAYGSSF